MNVEELRSYCLSLGANVEERFPFTAFQFAQNVLVFYIFGHMFCYFDINDLSNVTVKCQSEWIVKLKDHYDCIDKPFNGNQKYWIGINATIADDKLLKELIHNSFDIVSTKAKKR